MDLIFGAPQSGRRVLTCTLALLVVAAGLAAHLTARGPRRDFAPEGWRMTFRPPAGYLWEHTRRLGAQPEVYRFMGTTRQGQPTELEYWRLRVTEQATPLLVGFALLARDDPNSQIAQLAPQNSGPRTAPLGGRTAVQVVSQSRHIVVRVVVMDDLEAYAVRLQVDGQPLDADLLTLFDEVCDSVEFPPK